jgi:hypothetical protein
MKEWEFSEFLDDESGRGEACDCCAKARQRTIVQAIFFLIENDFPRPTPFSIRESRLHGLPADQPVAKACHDQNDWDVGLRPVIKIALVANETERLRRFFGEISRLFRFQLSGDKLARTSPASGTAPSCSPRIWPIESRAKIESILEMDTNVVCNR